MFVVRNIPVGGSIALGACMLLWACIAGFGQSQAAPVVTVLAGGTLIDGRGGAPLKDALVVIEGNRISALGRRGSVVVPEQARQIDVSGKFILPGLIDIHVHYNDWMGELFLAHGVTTVKDVGNYVEWVATASDEIEKRLARGPRLFFTGNGLDAPPPAREHFIGIENPATARRVVQLLHERGAVAVKVREKMTAELLRAITSEAHRLGMRVTGHIRKVDARAAAFAGIDGLEHVSGVVQATWDRPLEADLDALNEYVRYIEERKSYALINPKKAAILDDLLLQKKVALIPTISGRWRMVSDRLDDYAREDAEYAANPLLSYVPEDARRMWETSAIYKLEKAEDKELVKTGWEKIRELLLRHYRKGGRVLVGSDTYLSVPGLSLQREMQMFVDAGFTPGQVISMATRDNAGFLGRSTEIGTIERGKLADLLVVNADPLLDITALRRVDMVIKDGRVEDTNYHPDFSVPTRRKTLDRPLWIERRLNEEEANRGTSGIERNGRNGFVPPSEGIPTDANQRANVLALVGATVIDGEGGAPIKDGVVLIRGDRIVSVGRAGKVRVPQTARVIDIAGKYVIPGMIDMHVHYDSWMGELFLAHGVTTIKDLGNDAEWCAQVRDDIESGRASGPRFFYVGNGIDAPPPVRDHHIGLDDPVKASRAVELLRSRGVSAIKLREKSTPELIRATVKVAHRLGIPVTGHLVNTSAREAALAGIDGLEHATGIVEATATRHLKPDPSYTDVQRFVTELKAFAYIDEAKAEELVKFLAAKKVALIPTMANWWRFASERRDEFAREDAELSKNPSLVYVPNHIRQVWASSALYDIKDAEDLAEVKAGWRKVQAYLKPYEKAGGRVLAGSDTLISVPGLSLLRELMMLVDVGFTPMRAITAGTRDNANFLGQGRNLGTLAAGKLADLVVLGADPLGDIGNLRRVEMVFKNGREVDRTYHADYKGPTPKPRLERPLWIEKLLADSKTTGR